MFNEYGNFPKLFSFDNLKANEKKFNAIQKEIKEHLKSVTAPSEELKIKNYSLAIWLEYMNSLPTVNIPKEYIDPNNSVYSTSESLSLDDILPKSNGKLSKYSRTDSAFVFRKVQQLIDYISYIVYKNMLGGVAIDWYRDYVYCASVRAVVNTFLLPSPYITSSLIRRCINKRVEEYIGSGALQRPKLPKDAPTFKGIDRRDAKSRIAKLREDLALAFIRDIIETYNKQHLRLPFKDELVCEFCSRCSKYKESNLMEKYKHDVSKPTINRWLKMIGVVLPKKNKWMKN